MHDTGRQPIATAPRDGTQILLWCAGTQCDQRGYKLGYFIRFGNVINLLVNGVVYADFARSFPFWWQLPSPEQADQHHHHAGHDAAAATRDMFDG